MKVRCISNSFQLAADETGQIKPTISQGTTIWLDVGKTYELLFIEKGWYRIIDESGEDYLYPPELFEVLSV